MEPIPRSGGSPRRRPQLVGLGELLWDAYEDSKRLGGAPANVAYHAAALGNETIVATRVGVDELGREATAQLAAAHVSTDFIQVDTMRPTGVTHVRVNDRGEPSFSIPEEVAWDHLEWSSSWQALAESADVVCFGTLALRAPRSRSTILQFLRSTTPNAVRVFDVNLRHSFYSEDLLVQLLRRSDIVKLNELELEQLADMFAVTGRSIADSARELLKAHHLRLVCVTRGEEGSLLVTETDNVAHASVAVDVVDTTGAGDAFVAALAHHYWRGSSLDSMGRAANHLAAWVTTQKGATPPLEEAVVAATKDVDDTWP